MFQSTTLWPVWKNLQPERYSLLDADPLREICEAEGVTQSFLEENDFCFGCQDTSKCLQPYSPVLFARLTVANGLTMSCDELAQAWEADYKTSIEEELVGCVADLKRDYNSDQDGTNMPQSCPDFFFPSILDEDYETNNNDITVSSSIFPTYYSEVDAMYDAVDSFGYGSVYTETSYDTQYEDFNIIAMDAQVLTDMALAVGSAVITTIAMVIHTRSPFLAVVGLLQIILSFPVAFFFYTFVARLQFFPFLNFIGMPHLHAVRVAGWQRQ